MAHQTAGSRLAAALGDAVRQNGAFLYSIEAMDPYTAGRKAGEILDRLLARSSFLRRRRSGLTPLGRLWVAGLDESLLLEPPARGVEILSLCQPRPAPYAGGKGRNAPRPGSVQGNGADH